MTETETAIFRVISHEPMISQKELALKMEMSRSAVSVHVSSLMNKGHILGRGYVMNEEGITLLIGGALMDIHCFPHIAYSESNSKRASGNIKMYPGGPVRNIAEYLAKLEMHCSLISTLCDDSMGKEIKRNLEENSVDYKHSYFLDHEKTSSFVAMFDDQGLLTHSVVDTHTLDKTPLEHMMKKDALIKQSNYVVIDTALTESMIQYLCKTAADSKVILIPTAEVMLKRVDSVLSQVDTIVCLYEHAQSITGEQDEYTMSEKFIYEGVNHVYIMMDNFQVLYRSQTEVIKRSLNARRFANISGARDALSAGIIYGYNHDYTIEEILDFGIAMASIAVEDGRPVSKRAKLADIQLKIKEMNA